MLVWDGKKEELLHRFNHRRPVTAVTVSGDGRLLVVGISGSVLGRLLEQSELMIYSLVTRQPLWRIPLNAEIEAASISMVKGLTFKCFGEVERCISLVNAAIEACDLRSDAMSRSDAKLGDVRARTGSCSSRPRTSRFGMLSRPRA